MLKLAARHAGVAVHSLAEMAPLHIQRCACDVGDPCQKKQLLLFLQWIWEQLSAIPLAQLMLLKTQDST